MEIRKYEYDPNFAIRGLHYDVQRVSLTSWFSAVVSAKCCLIKTPGAFRGRWVGMQFFGAAGGNYSNIFGRADRKREALERRASRAPAGSVG